MHEDGDALRDLLGGLSLGPASGQSRRSGHHACTPVTQPRHAKPQMRVVPSEMLVPCGRPVTEGESRRQETQFDVLGAARRLAHPGWAAGPHPARGPRARARRGGRPRPSHRLAPEPPRQSTRPWILSASQAELRSDRRVQNRPRMITSDIFTFLCTGSSRPARFLRGPYDCSKPISPPFAVDASVIDHFADPRAHEEDRC